MKITAVRLTPVNIPLELPYLWTGGLYPGTSKVIIEVETDEGLTGLGEAPSDELLPTLRSVADRIVGRDPLDIADLEARCVPPWQIVSNTDGNAVVRAFGAIEIALWDIRGKAWGQPLYQLLGGAVRREIPFAEYFAFRASADGRGAHMDVDSVVEHCVAMREEHGSTIFEGKLIHRDPDVAVEAVRRLREALGPKAVIRLDSNMAWSMPTAIRMARQLEPLDIRNWEDPVGTLEEMAQLRRHTSIPFSTHSADLRRVVALGAPDTLVLNFAVLGGIARTVRFIGACEAMGVGFWCYSGDAGIATAAYLHMSAAMPHITEPSQSLFRWQVGDVIRDGPFRQRNNVVRVPDGPGLGVELDPDALERWHRHYVDNGPLDHYLDPWGDGHYWRLPLG
jgi:glucarate dehydratase